MASEIEKRFPSVNEFLFAIQYAEIDKTIVISCQIGREKTRNQPTKVSEKKKRKASTESSNHDDACPIKQ
jgi:hypothetical protein